MTLNPKAQLSTRVCVLREPAKGSSPALTPQVPLRSTGPSRRAVSSSSGALWQALTPAVQGKADPWDRIPVLVHNLLLLWPVSCCVSPESPGRGSEHRLAGQGWVLTPAPSCIWGSDPRCPELRPFQSCCCPAPAPPSSPAAPAPSCQSPGRGEKNVTELLDKGHPHLPRPSAPSPHPRPLFPLTHTL